MKFGRFNPRPVFRPGDASRNLSIFASGSGFNPRPVFRPGDAVVGVVEQVRLDAVSIRARFLGRAMRPCLRSSPDSLGFQSAPGF